MLLILLYLLLFFGLGAPISAALPRWMIDRWATAPVFGLAVFGVLCTIAFFNDHVAIGTYILLFIFLLFLVTAIILSKERTWIGTLMLFAILVGVICIAPPRVGGVSFAIFQSNPNDQVNCFSEASAYSSFSCHSLKIGEFPNNVSYTATASSLLDARPAVGIMLAALRSWLYPTTAEAAYPFQALLQTITAFGVLFAVRNIFEGGRLLSMVLADRFLFYRIFPSVRF